MKKLIASIIALIAINASAYDVTNTVTIVSNIYNRISEEHWITNNIKNTHTNYHYTNNVYTVSNVTLLVSQQTFKTNTTVNLDVSQQAIAEARAQANRAERIATNAFDFANAAANSATTAQSHAADAKDYRDEAEYYMEQAHGQVQPIIDEGARQLALVTAAGNEEVGKVNSAGSSQVQNVRNEGNYQVNRVDYRGEYNVGSVNNAGTTALNNITAKQQWFEEHFGQMVTNVYIAEDEVAREMANSAQTTANEAQTTANEAQTTANSAQTTANEALDHTTSLSNSLATVAFSGNYNDLTNKPPVGPATEFIINENADNQRAHITYTVYAGPTTNDSIVGWIKIYKGEYNITFSSGYFHYLLTDYECCLTPYTPSDDYYSFAQYIHPPLTDSGFILYVSLNSSGAGFQVKFPNFRSKGRIFDFPKEDESYTVKDLYSGKTVNWLVKITDDTLSHPSNYYKMKGLKIYDKSGNHVDTVQLESNQYSTDEMKLLFKYFMN